jgi:hypothetical protein
MLHMGFNSTSSAVARIKHMRKLDLPIGTIHEYQSIKR